VDQPHRRHPGAGLSIAAPTNTAIARRFVEAGLVDVAQERLRAVAAVPPQCRMQAREQRARRAMPAVPEIAGELGEPLRARRQLHPRVESMDGSLHLR
jgi:hypothetical protein